MTMLKFSVAALFPALLSCAPNPMPQAGNWNETESATSDSNSTSSDSDGGHRPPGAVFRRPDITPRLPLPDNCPMIRPTGPTNETHSYGIRDGSFPALPDTCKDVTFTSLENMKDDGNKPWSFVQISRRPDGLPKISLCARLRPKPECCAVRHGGAIPVEDETYDQLERLGYVFESSGRNPALLLLPAEEELPFITGVMEVGEALVCLTMERLLF